MKLQVLELLLIIVIITPQVKNGPSEGPFTFIEYFCKGNRQIKSHFNYYLSRGYSVYIKKAMSALTEIKVQLDSGSTVEIYNVTSRFSADKDVINNIFTFVVIKDVDELGFTVKGRYTPNHPPYIISLKINGVENCRDPDRKYFQNYVAVAKLYENAPDKFCGRRRINRRYTELIVSGSATKAGDWPWHAALMKLKKSTLKYIGGGTLISKYIVLTAAHCITSNGIPVNPEIMSVILGKYTLVARDIVLQEKEVFRIIVHHNFNHRTLDNDIGLMKLTTEAIYNNYVQPACIWFDGIYDHIGSYEIKGAVRTAACNGDSGGGFMVFVQDDLNKNYIGEDYIDGAWYVKGIVSVTLARNDASICDPSAYTVFTDVAVYRDWILSHME